MRYTIIGGGAAGGIIGELLFSGGKETEIIDRNKKHVEAVRNQELEIRKVNGPVRIPIKAYTPEEYDNEGKRIECAILCVRMEELDEAVCFLLPKMIEGGIVISFCEGGDIHTRDEEKVETIQGVAIMDGASLAQGLIHCGYLSELLLESGEKDSLLKKELKKDLKDIPAFSFIKNIDEARWGAAVHCMITAAASITNQPCQEAAKETRICNFRSLLQDELLGQAKKEGKNTEQIKKFISKYEVCQKSSTKVRSRIWRDLAVRKRKTESGMMLDKLFLTVQKEGRNLDACQSLKDLLTKIEEGKRGLEVSNIDWLMKEYKDHKDGSWEGPHLKITVVGIGAIGSVVGAYLARGGADVEFVDANEAHVNAVNERGLEIREQKRDSGAESFIAWAKAFTPEQYVKRGIPAECILLSVKAQYTKEALTQLLPVMDENSFVVSVQNGVTEFDIEKVVGRQRTVCGFVNIGADYIEPGLVHFGTKGPVAAGEWDGSRSKRIRRLEKAMEAADMFKISDNPMGYVWAKLAYSAITVVTTLTNETVAITIAKEKYHEMMANLVAEALAVADAEHVSMEGMAFDKFDPEDVYPREGRNRDKLLAMMKDHATIMKGTTKVHSGTWRDIVVRKRRAESHEHFRPVFELAEKHGIPMPMCRKLLVMLQEIEDGKRNFSDDNLDELLEMDMKIYPRD